MVPWLAGKLPTLAKRKLSALVLTAAHLALLPKRVVAAAETSMTREFPKEELKALPVGVHEP